LSGVCGDQIGRYRCTLCSTHSPDAQTILQHVCRNHHENAAPIVLPTLAMFATTEAMLRAYFCGMKASELSERMTKGKCTAFPCWPVLEPMKKLDYKRKCDMKKVGRIFFEKYEGKWVDFVGACGGKTARKFVGETKL